MGRAQRWSTQLSFPAQKFETPCLTTFWVSPPGSPPGIKSPYLPQIHHPLPSFLPQQNHLPRLLSQTPDVILNSFHSFISKQLLNAPEHCSLFYFCWQALTKALSSFSWTAVPVLLPEITPLLPSHPLPSHPNPILYIVAGMILLNDPSDLVIPCSKLCKLPSALR